MIYIVKQLITKVNKIYLRESIFIKVYMRKNDRLCGKIKINPNMLKGGAEGMKGMRLDENERTRDVFEEKKGYSKPPLIPLPEPGDLSSLDKLGIKPGKISHGIVKAAMFATGFKSFQRQLPDNLESILRRNDMRGGGLFAPVISATLVLKDDPRNLNPIERAATLVCAARSLWEDIITGKLEPDRYGDQVLEMGQYPNLFSTCLIFDGKRPRIFKSINVSQVVVVIARRFFLLNISNLGSETALEQLKDAFSKLVLLTREKGFENFELSPGILTSASNKTQQKAFSRLQRFPINRESLAILRHSFLTLCLDFDLEPSSYTEAAKIGHIGNFGNRWFHSSLQLVVFGNAKAGTICNFSTYLDGNTMMRGSAELQRRAAAYPINNGKSKTFVSLNKPTELQWKVHRSIIQQAQRDVQLVKDNQPATFEIKNIGKKFLTDHKITPVPAFILALQMTANHFAGKMVKIIQFLSMSKYRCMDRVNAMVTTPEVNRFVEYMEQEDMQRDEAKKLLHKAIESQNQECRRSRQYLLVPAMFTLFLRSKRGLGRLYIMLVAAIAYIPLKILGLIKSPKCEVPVSHPEIYPEIPIVGRPGIRLPYVKYFSLNYQILDDKIIITMMPGLRWRVPNEKLIAVLKENLERIKSVF